MWYCDGVSTKGNQMNFLLAASTIWDAQLWNLGEDLESVWSARLLQLDGKTTPIHQMRILKLQKEEEQPRKLNSTTNDPMGWLAWWLGCRRYQYDERLVQHLQRPRRTSLSSSSHTAAVAAVVRPYPNAHHRKKNSHQAHVTASNGFHLRLLVAPPSPLRVSSGLLMSSSPRRSGPRWGWRRAAAIAILVVLILSQMPRSQTMKNPVKEPPVLKLPAVFTQMRGLLIGRMKKRFMKANGCRLRLIASLKYSCRINNCTFYQMSSINVNIFTISPLHTFWFVGSVPMVKTLWRTHKLGEVLYPYILGSCVVETLWCTQNRAKGLVHFHCGVMWSPL
jgi:hypothetical protein